MEQELEKILNASSPVLVSVVVMFIVWGLKKAPFFANWLLPFAAMALGATFYPMLEGWTQKTILQGTAVGGLAVCFNQQFKQLLARFGVKVGGDTEVFKKTDIAPLVAIGMAFLVSGCAQFSTLQTDESYDPETGKPIRKISTRASSSTFYESKSSLSKWKALQSDKSQGAEVGGLTQSSDASSNIVATVRAVFEGIASGAVKAASPVPLPKKKEEPTAETP